MNWVELGAIGVAITTIITIIIASHRYSEGKRARIYERLDETKRHFEAKMENEYTRKDIFSLTHQQVERELKEIKEQTKFIPNIAAKLELLVNGKKRK